MLVCSYVQSYEKQQNSTLKICPSNSKVYITNKWKQWNNDYPYYLLQQWKYSICQI